MIHMKANTRRAVALSDDLITTGSAGIEVEILCSEAWDGLTKTVLFHGSGSSVDMILTGDSCTVPPEVLTAPGGELLIGLYGTDGSGSLAIPTVWADAGRILPGAVPSGIAPTPAQKSALDQAIEALQNATEEIPEQIDTALAEAKASGEFDGAPGVGVPAGGAPNQVLAKASGADFDTEWVDQSGGGGDNIFWATYGTTTATEVADALTAGKIVAVRYVDHIYDLSYLGNLGNDRIYYFTNVVVNNVSTLSLYQSTWTNEGIQMIPSASSSNPAALGTAAPGTSSKFARADHVHPMPSAADVGAGTYSKPSGGIPKTDLASAVQTSLGKADTALQSYTETDPTVPAWAKAANKPSYTASEVGALPASTTIPSKTSDLTNDSGFVNASGAAAAAPVQSVNSKTGAVVLTASDVGAGTYSKPSGGIPKTDLASAVQTSLGKADTALQSYTETDPTVPAWAKASSKPSYTASEVGAAPAVTEVTVSTAGAVTQALDAGKLYHFTGALTALTITLNAAPSGQLAQYHFDFDCGSTAPTVTIPSTVILPDGNSFEADRHYEVDILNNYGAVISWANS